MLDAHQLNVFVTAAESLNFTETARRLHMSQPSVSQHIQALEQHFGVELFLRTGRRLSLTDAGAILLPLARAFVQQSIQIEEEMASLHGAVVGHLIVGCSTTPGKYLLPHLLTAFHHHHPQVRVTCQVTSQMQVDRLLEEGAVHFALASTHLTQIHRFETRYFTSDPVVLIAPHNHPWAERDHIQPADLQQAHFIMREPTSGTYQAVAEVLHAHGLDPAELNTILTLGNSEAIALAVEQGLGVGFVSNIVVEQITPRRVAVIRIAGVEICRDIFIARNTRYPPTRAQLAFWDFIANLPTPFLYQNCTTPRPLT